jgi:hypothetical protein
VPSVQRLGGAAGARSRLARARLYHELGGECTGASHKLGLPKASDRSDVGWEGLLTRDML